MRLVLVAVCASSLAHAAPDLAKEARAILEEIMVIDTQNPPGNEDVAVQKLAARLRAAGAQVDIVPFAPGRSSLVARIKGTGAKKPLLLLAHLDVVGAKDQPWTVPPIKVTEKDGYLYGRGVLDDKGWAAAATSVFLDRLRSGKKLPRDLILALTGDEESGGGGVREILAKQPQLFADAEIALNEGGTTLLDASKKPRVSFVQTAEKTFQTFDVTARGRGGHSSLPHEDNAIYALGRALGKLESYRFPPRLSPAVREALGGRAQMEVGDLAQALRALSTAPDPVPVAAMERVDKHPILRNLYRTTCVATMMDGGTRENVLPVQAHAVVNCRLVPSEKAEETLLTLKTIVGDKLEVKPWDSIGVGPETQFAPDVRAAITAAGRAVFGDVTISSALGTGASDSRFLRQKGIACYGLGLFPLGPDDLNKPHAPDERIPAASFPVGVRFLDRVVQELTH